MPSTDLKQLIGFNPCAAITMAKVVLPDGPFTAADARVAGLEMDDIVWGITKIAWTDKDVYARLHRWLDDCHAHAISECARDYSLEHRDQDMRIRAREFANGNDDAATEARRRAVWRVAWAKANGVAKAAAKMSIIASSSKGHAIADTRSAWNAAKLAARAAEDRWQFDHLVLCFS